MDGVESVAEDERRARELHDSVTQTLFAATVLSSTLARGLGRGHGVDSDRAVGQAAALERLNSAALAEMRLLLVELRPEALAATPLPKLLRDAVESLACRVDAVVEASLMSADDLCRDARMQFYRIAQLALSNVARQGGVRHCRVSWTSAPALARLGIAFDGADAGAGLGPSAREVRAEMRRRARAIGATLRLIGAPGGGSEVIVEWRPQAPRAAAGPDSTRSGVPS